jgi:acyl carrier protein
MRSKVLQLIRAAIDEVNQQLPAEGQLAKNETAVITGSDGTLDSLAFLNLILCAQSQVDAALHTSVNLASALMESDREPPRTVGDLADLITSRLEGTGCG